MKPMVPGQGATCQRPARPMGNAAFAAAASHINPREEAPRARLPWHSLILLQARVACLASPGPPPSPRLFSPLRGAPAEREVNEPGREMGPDSSPKKWNLKEQRSTYLQWFSLADEGLLHDPSHLHDKF